MNAQEITYADNADPAVVAKIEAARAKLKPCCTRCRKNLLKKELAGRICIDRSACTVRAITRRPKFTLLYANPPRGLRRDY